MDGSIALDCVDVGVYYKDVLDFADRVKNLVI